MEIEKQINNEAQDLINDNNIKGKIPKLDKKPAYVTIKDHKENFPRKVTCRLINPTKTHIGKVSKQILDNINNSIRRNTSLTQWKNTNEVINWFNQISNKKNKYFIKFDIVDFYPSITKKSILEALSFANKFIKVNNEDRDILVKPF